MHRSNPPVKRLPRAIERFAEKHRHELVRAGALPEMVPLGCGAFGCTVLGRNRVVKITEDQDEIDLVLEISRIRSSRLPSVSESSARMLARVGITPSEVRTLPGYVKILSRPRCIGRRCIYAREEIRPIDAIKGPKGRARKRRIGRALDGFFYSSRSKTIEDSVEFLYRYPELRVIMQTVVGLQVVYGLVAEDIHEEQVGEVIHGSAGRPKGTLVLYDGQVSRGVKGSSPVRENPQPGAGYMERRAIEEFGTTNDPRAAGYVMERGEMLNFGGPAGRDFDHRQIGMAFEDTDFEGGITGMHYFMRETGAARVHFAPNEASVQWKSKPTLAQIRVISSAIGRGRYERVYIDVLDETKVLHFPTVHDADEVLREMRDNVAS